MTLKFNRVLEVVKVHVRAKLHQAKCSGSWFINSALDFGQLQTLIANISGMDQAIDTRKTTIFSTFAENNLVNFGARTKVALTFNLWHWHSTGTWRLSRYMCVQNCIKLCAAVHELSCAQRKKLRRKQYCPSLPRR